MLLTWGVSSDDHGHWLLQDQRETRSPLINLAISTQGLRGSEHIPRAMSHPAWPQQLMLQKVQDATFRAVGLFGSGAFCDYDIISRKLVFCSLQCGSYTCIHCEPIMHSRAGYGAFGEARTCDRKDPADLRADSLATVPPVP
ncbi:hypothetical protein PoB_000085100 [Plakobranchus ocellatus]|uniref:Uncharacterized protein n=1 Tax=Plakobranchus ocellatus TaxID=259542 RepID=A0AAV3WW01_9GAST|nr:hypothetical protein PoB_000085100 [Plakobranchus ocellatus]